MSDEFCRLETLALIGLFPVDGMYVFPTNHALV
jgi:hypothetical protein